jgi:hypothetical protein
MPFNLAKKYPDLLEIVHLKSYERLQLLRTIFDRDINENPNFKFRGKPIHPIKTMDGVSAMDTLFTHLTHETIKETDIHGRTYKSRDAFEIDRSKRLHWIKYHIDENKKDEIEVFSVIERDQKQRRDVTRTYVYDKTQKYVIVLEIQRSLVDYYLLSAYYLNKSYGEKTMKKKIKRKLPDVY